MVGASVLHRRMELRVKGKQVQILYDLVTVNRRATLHDAIAKVSRRGAVMTGKPGILPAIGTGVNLRSRGIDRTGTYRFWWFICVILERLSSSGRSLFLCGILCVKTVFYPEYQCILVIYFCANDTRRKRK